MNAEIESRLEKYLNVLETITADGFDFAKEQIPLVAQEMLNWAFYSSLIWSVIWGLITFGTLIPLIKLFKFWKIVRHDNVLFSKADESLCGIVLITLTTIIFCVMTLAEMSNCVKVCVAPRVVLIEKIKSLK